MRLFFLEEELPQNLGDEFEISGEDARHISRVLRLTAGEEILVAYAGDENKKAARAVIIKSEAGGVKLRLAEMIEKKSEPSFQVWLAQGMPKGDKMDFIVQKAVELGVFGIIPVACQNCVVRYDRRKEDGRRERWQKIAREAAKQCGRLHIPRIMSVTSLSELFDKEPPILPEGVDMPVFMLYEGERERGIKSALSKRLQGLQKPFSCLLIVGPEGGFSAQEVELAKDRGADIVTMGSRILRTETAALASISALMYEFGEFG